MGSECGLMDSASSRVVETAEVGRHRLSIVLHSILEKRQRMIAMNTHDHSPRMVYPLLQGALV